MPTSSGQSVFSGLWCRVKAAQPVVRHSLGALRKKIQKAIGFEATEPSIALLDGNRDNPLVSWIFFRFLEDVHNISYAMYVGILPILPSVFFNHSVAIICSVVRTEEFQFSRRNYLTFAFKKEPEGGVDANNCAFGTIYSSNVLSAMSTLTSPSNHTNVTGPDCLMQHSEEACFNMNIPWLPILLGITGGCMLVAGYGLIEMLVRKIKQSSERYMEERKAWQNRLVDHHLDETADVLGRATPLPSPLVESVTSFLGQAPKLKKNMKDSSSFFCCWQRKKLQLEWQNEAERDNDDEVQVPYQLLRSS